MSHAGAVVSRDEYLDQGDGAVALIHPVDVVPKTVLLDARASIRASGAPTQ